MKNKHLTLIRVLVILGLVIVSIPAVIAFGTFSSIKGHLEREMDETNKGYARLLSKQAILYLREPQYDLERIISSLNKTDATKKDIISELSFLIDNEHFSHFQSVDHNGIVQFSYPEDSEYDGSDVSGMDLYKIPIETQKNYWGASFVSAKSNLPMTSISVPWQHGIIIAYLDLSGLTRLIEPAVKGEASIFAITDQNGTFVAHTNIDNVNQRKVCPLNHKLGAVDHGEITRLLLKRADGDYFCYFMSAGVPGWNVVSCQKVEVIHAPVQRIMHIFIAIGLLAVIISFALLYLIFRHSLSSFSTFTSSIKMISQGHYSTHIPEQKLLEFNTLATSVNTMSDHIQARESQLQDQNTQLQNEIESRVQLEKENREFQEYLDVLIESMPSSIIAINADYTIRHFNSKSLETCGKAQDYEPVNLQDLVPTELCSADDIDLVLKTGEPINKSKITLRLNDKKCYFNATTFPLPFKNNIIAVIKIDTITDQVRIEKMMMQTEKMTSVAGLAAGMAHEINNPLASITQGIQNIQRRLDPTLHQNVEEAQKYDIDLNSLQLFLNERKINKFLNGGRDAVGRAAQIVKNMLLFSRKSGSGSTMINLPALIETVINLGTADYNLNNKYDFKFIDIVQEYDKNFPRINGCASELEQVLLNLFKNATHAMEEVDKEGYKPQFTIRLIREENYARIEVEDNGPGMPPDVQERIFEPFFTTKPVGLGTGLGLSVSYMIITQNHNGTFECESKLGQGTKFIIRLPL